MRLRISLTLSAVLATALLLPAFGDATASEQGRNQPFVCGLLSILSQRGDLLRAKAFIHCAGVGTFKRGLRVCLQEEGPNGFENLKCARKAKRSPPTDSTFLHVVAQRTCPTGGLHEFRSSAVGFAVSGGKRKTYESISDTRSLCG